MSSLKLEQQTVAMVNAHTPQASRTLRAYRIDPSSRMTLAVAAEAASMTTDELLAVVEERQRRAALRVAKLKAHPEYEYMREAELTY